MMTVLNLSLSNCFCQNIYSLRPKIIALVDFYDSCLTIRLILKKNVKILFILLLHVYHHIYFKYIIHVFTFAQIF
jgi:hypothetical protein